MLVTSNPREVAEADRIVLPGVGAFADCRAGLYGVPGMVDTLQRAVIEQGKPFLGICVGMQLMATRGVEYGIHAGLDWIRATSCASIPARTISRSRTWAGTSSARSSRTPCSTASPRATTPISCTPSSSRRAVPETVLALTDYGGPITAVVGRDNLAGTQFHPEKSQATGLKLIANFLRWKP